MRCQRPKFKKLLFSVSILFAALILLGGCKKKLPTPPVPTETPPSAMTEAKQAAETVSAEIEQTICPVLEGPIDKNIFTEYQGKKVYFCCSSCKVEFEKNPEKYISKLPQFKK